MLFLVDNTIHSSNREFFTKLVYFFEKHNVRYISIANKEMLNYYLDIYTPSCFILSGSPLKYTEKDFLEHEAQYTLNLDIITKYKSSVPILGICFGAQLINLYFGGELGRLKKSICDRIDRLFFCLNYLITRLGNGLVPLMEMKYMGPVCFRHVDNEIYGCLFHPEYDENTQEFILEFLQNI